MLSLNRMILEYRYNDHNKTKKVICDKCMSRFFIYTLVTISGILNIRCF